MDPGCWRCSSLLFVVQRFSKSYSRFGLRKHNEPLNKTIKLKDNINKLRKLTYTHTLNRRSDLFSKNVRNEQKLKKKTKSN